MSTVCCVRYRLMRPNSLVPHHLHGQDPSFLVVAGIVFTVLTGEVGLTQESETNLEFVVESQGFLWRLLVAS